MTVRNYPDAIYGCGHLSPMGWCGACGTRDRVYGPGSRPIETRDQIITRVSAATREALRGQEFASTDDLLGPPERPSAFLPACCEVDR